MRKRNSHQLSATFCLICLLGIFFFTIPVLSLQAIAAEQNELDDLWIDLSIGSPLIDLFNERALENDIARVEHISQLDLLKDINHGKKLVVFKSAQDAIRLLPHMHDELDIIGYNLEHGPANPQNEQENPTDSIRQLREVADRYNLEVALGPDRRFAISDGAEMAPYADYFILQIQKVQTEPEAVYDFALPVIEDVREANPDIQISVQVRTEGDIEELFSMLEPMQGEIDGISILTSVETVEVAEEMVGALRNELSSEPIPTPVEKTGSTEINIPQSTIAVTELNEVIEELIEPSAAVESESVAEPEIEDIIELTLDAVSDDGILSTPEQNQKNGSTWVLIIVALIIGVAIGAGYVSYRAGS